MDKGSVVLELILALRKAEAADRTCKYDVLHDRINYLIDKWTPHPITDWKNGHYGEKEKS